MASNVVRLEARLGYAGVCFGSLHHYCFLIDFTTKYTRLSDKVAGFVDQSLRIDMKRAVLKKKFQSESTNQIFKDSDSQIWISKDLFCTVVLKIREDLLDS